MTHERDYYRILQVDPLSEPDVIEAAYKRLVWKYHPDGLEPDAAKTALLNEAYETLRSPTKRAQYDAQRQPGIEGQPPSPPASPSYPLASAQPAPPRRYSRRMR
jgi:curved DNA-binding protein CbpA